MKETYENKKTSKKMNIEYDCIDSQIVEMVRLLNENGMLPFASCDGTVDTHIDAKTRRYNHQLAYLAMMDSELGRNFLAILQDDQRFQIRFFYKGESLLYGNLVKGICYAVDFDNYDGKRSEILEQILREVLNGKEPSSEKRERIDKIVNAIQKIHEIDGVNAEVSFNDVAIKMPEDSNFGITITDSGKKDLTSILERNHILPEDVGAEFEARGAKYKVYTSSYEDLLNVLDGIILNYNTLKKVSNIPSIYGFGNMAKRKVNMTSNEEIERYIENFERMSEFNQPVEYSIEDLLSVFFSENSNDDGEIEN